MHNLKFFVTYMQSNALQFADCYVHNEHLKELIKSGVEQNTKLLHAFIDSSIIINKDIYNLTKQ